MSQHTQCNSLSLVFTIADGKSQQTNIRSIYSNLFYCVCLLLPLLLLLPLAFDVCCIWLDSGTKQKKEQQNFSSPLKIRTLYVQHSRSQPVYFTFIFQAHRSPTININVYRIKQCGRVSFSNISNKYISNGDVNANVFPLTITIFMQIFFYAIGSYSRSSLFVSFSRSAVCFDFVCIDQNVYSASELYSGIR